ncbi:MAG TPA: hypothetical protein VFF68_08845 [Anaerolineaceae bacterium]|nr:hypothetical protein [Anaerolineaceae bacterium]
MNYEPITPEAEALDQFLNGYTLPAGALPEPEAELAAELLRLAEAVQAQPAPDPQLEARLAAAYPPRRSVRPAWTALRPWAFSLAGAAALVTLLVLAAPLLLHSRQPDSTQLPLIGLPTAAATGNLPASDRPLLPRLSAEWVSAMPADVEVLRSVQLSLSAALPDGPQQVAVYRQVPLDLPLTAESAAAMARRLGVTGELLTRTGEASDTLYTVTDGISSVLFYGASPLEFTYQLRPQAAAGPQPLAIAFEEQVAIATAWLSERGLLDFPYRTGRPPADASGVMVLPDFPAGELFLNNPYSPLIHVQIGADGRVEQVLYRAMQTEVSGDYPIISAAEAWEMIQAGNLDQPGVLVRTFDFSGQLALRTWSPQLTPDYPADLYGKPVFTGLQDPDLPQAEVMRVPLKGALAGLPEETVHVWGTVRQDEQGRAWLQVQGWEPAGSLEEVNIEGTIAWRDGTGILLTAEGVAYSLWNLPADVPAGARVHTRGVVVDQNRLMWDFVQTVIDDSGMNSAGAIGQPAPTGPDPDLLAALGYAPGDRFEGVEVSLQSVIYARASGEQRLVHSVYLPPKSGGEERSPVELTGPGLEGIERYNQFAVRLWGSYMIEDEKPFLFVERYEPVQPELAYDVFFGPVTERVLEGKVALVLTDDDGQEWVLKHATDFGQTLASLGWPAGQEAAVEGYPLEGETFGGLPVLFDQGMAMLGHKNLTRESYQPHANQPAVIFEEEVADVLPGEAVVDQADIVYYAADFSHGLASVRPPAGDLLNYIQPLWRFSGHLADGRAFEILVQAVEDGYLR